MSQHLRRQSSAFGDLLVVIIALHMKVTYKYRPRSSVAVTTKLLHHLKNVTEPHKLGMLTDGIQIRISQEAIETGNNILRSPAQVLL